MNPQDWAAAIIARGHALGAVPKYGDDAWRDLQPSDPRAVAAVAVAAEAWRAECDPKRIAEQLRAELAAEQEVAEQDAAVEFQRLVTALAGRPTYAELNARRGQTERADRTRARAAARPTVAELRDVELAGEGR